MKFKKAIQTTDEDLVTGDFRNDTMRKALNTFHCSNTIKMISGMVEFKAFKDTLIPWHSSFEKIFIRSQLVVATFSVYDS